MKYTHIIIILPGFTMDSEDMKYYKDKLTKTFSDFKIKYKILNPPVRKITIYKNKKYNSWYDYLTPHCNKEPIINEEQLLQSRNRIHKILDNVSSMIRGGRDGRIAGGGPKPLKSLFSHDFPISPNILLIVLSHHLMSP